MFVNKHVLDVIVVVVISSVCYVDNLLCHDFSGSNPSDFSAQKRKEKTYFWYILNMASGQVKSSSPNSADQTEK